MNDPLSPGLAEAFGGDENASPRASVLRTLLARTGVALGVHLEDREPDDAPVRVTDEAKELRDPSGRYQVLGEIGRGGVGVVYKGRDTDLGRDVAMKVLRDEFAARPDVLARFVEEAQIGGQLQHPGIVPVYELGLQAGERPYFAMKLVKGETLAEQLARRADPAQDRRRLLGVFEQVCQTVAYAHARRVIHRDLKPANVMIGAFGEVQVVDWGFAKVLAKGGTADEAESARAASERSVIETVRSAADSGSHSLPGSMMGTPAYMPPEQAQGDIARLDRRSDVFALGAVLCELLTGQPPYREQDGDLGRQAANAELDGAHRRLRSCGADEPLIELCLECLAPARRARPESAAEVAERVGAWLTSVEERARQAELRAAEARYKTRATRVVAAAGLAVVLLGAGTWVWVAGQRQTRRAEAAQRVAAAVSAASAAHGKAQAATLDATLWDAALATVEQAATLARTDEADSTTRAEAERLLATVEAERGAVATEIARLERDAAMLARLETLRIPTDDDIRQPAWWTGELERLDREYADAFEAYLGGPLHDTPSEVALADLQRGDLETELAASLDHWAQVREMLWEQDLAPDYARVESPRALAALLDPGDAWRTRLRELLPAASENGEALRALAEEADLAEMPAAVCRVLQLALWRAGETEAAVEVLRRGREAHPRDFDLCFLLAQSLERLDAPRWDEAVATYRIARALRPDHAEVLHRMGLASHELRRYEDSERAFRALHERAPGDAHWLRHLGTALLRQGRTDEAIELFERAVALDPEDGQTHQVMGLALAVLGLDELAIEQFERAIALQPWNAEAMTALGKALARRGRLEEAIASHERAIEVDRTEADWLVGKANTLRLAGRPEEAGVLYRRAIELEPDDVGPLIGLGNVLCDLGRHEEGLEHYRRAIEFDPDSAQAFNNIGDVLIELGRADEAIEPLRRAVELDPWDPRFQHTVARGLFATGELDEAAELYLGVIAARPGSSSAHVGLGLVHSELGDPDAARACYARALELDARNYSAHVNLGNLHLQRGEWDEARVQYQRAVELDGRSATAHANLADVLRRLGRVEDALAHCDRVRELDPRRGDLHRTVAEVLLESGRLEEALACLGRAIELDPDDANTVQAHGHALLRKGDLEAAAARFERVLELDPGRADARVNLAVALRRLREPEAALKNYEAALEIDPDNAWAHAGKGFLLLRRGEPEAAEASVRRAIELDPELAPPRVNLGNILRDRGDREGALEAYESALELFSQERTAFAREWVGRLERQISQLLGQVHAGEVLARRRPPSDSDEWEAAVDRGYDEGRFAEVVALTEAVLADSPELVRAETGALYDSACAAALLASDPEEDLSAEGLRRVRALANAWLGDVVERWTTRLEADGEGAGDARAALEHALDDPDFDGLRGDATEALPADERAGWRELWSRIERALGEDDE